jgi:hypothetical protein
MRYRVHDIVYFLQEGRVVSGEVVGYDCCNYTDVFASDAVGRGTFLEMMGKLGRRGTRYAILRNIPYFIQNLVILDECMLFPSKKELIESL